MRRKKYRPAGAEFDGKCRQIEKVARQTDIAFQAIRLAEYLFFNGEQWTIRTVFEKRIEDQWVEMDWSPLTHSISIPPPGSSPEADRPSG